MRDPFDHPDHRASEELAFDAERLMRAGREHEAREKYAEAGHHELVVAREVHAVPKLRSIFAISAAACYLHAQRWHEAARTAHEFLALPELLTSAGARELEDLLDQALRGRDLAEVFRGGELVPLEIRLEGGLVGRGVAPTKLIQEREEVAEALLLRIADWKAGHPFRARGVSPLAASLQFYEAPARAASYGIRLFVGAAPQAAPPESTCSPRQAVEAFLILAAQAQDSAEAVRSAVLEPHYAHAFLRAFRDLAPDGSRVGNVTFSSSARLHAPPAISFTPAARASLSGALARADQTPIEVRGTLKLISLKKPRRRIVVETEPNVAHEFRLHPGEHDDTIGPKLNRRVHVVGKRVRGDVFAVDVELLDE